MKPSYSRAFGIGAIAGLVLAVAATLFAGATGGVPKLDTIGEEASLEPVFSVPASAMWIVVILTAAAVGLLLAIITHAVARVIAPEARSVGLWVTAPLGAIVGGVVAFAVIPLGVTGLGSVADGLATISVTSMIGLAAIVGVAGGATIVWQSYILARPPQAEDDPELLPDPELLAS